MCKLCVIMCNYVACASVECGNFNSACKFASSDLIHGLAVACCAQHLTEMSLLRGMHELSARTGSIHIGSALSGVHSGDLWDSRAARSSPPSTSHSSAHMLEKFQHQWLQHGPWISLVSMQHFAEKIAAAHGANLPCLSVGT